MKEQKENAEKDNLKDRIEDIKNTFSDKADEFAKDAKGKAENFAEKTLDGVEKLINDVFKKNKPEDAEFEEEAIDPKDVEIAELKKEMDELRDKYVRLYADFDNYKKRTEKQRLELIQTASKDIIKELLPVIDDFERALKALDGDSEAKNGMQLIYNKLVSNLNTKGLSAIDAIGKDFNVDEHEAITEVPVANAAQAGKVIDQVEKGYYLNGKLIRFAKVIVGKKAE